GRAQRIVRGLHHQRRHGANERRLRHIFIPVPSEIAYHLAATSRMANMNRILQVEMIGDGFQIVGIMIHVVSAAGLSPPAMSASIGAYDSETFAEEKKHLRIPIVGT